MAASKVALLKELGGIMGARESLQREIATLAKRELELMVLIQSNHRDMVADIRDAIIDVLKALRNDHNIWVPPRRIVSLVAQKVPNVLNEEIAHQLRALANLKGSNVAHNKQVGRGSAYFYIGLDQ